MGLEDLLLDFFQGFSLHQGNEKKPPFREGHGLGEDPVGVAEEKAPLPPG